MMNRINTFCTIALAVAAALMIGGVVDVDAQASNPLEDFLTENTVVTYEWRMFGGNVAGTGGSGGSGGSDNYTGSTGSVGREVRGATWMYHTATGKVYRVIEDACVIADDISGIAEPSNLGCLIPIPVASNSPYFDRLDSYLPNPAAEDPPGFH